MKSWTREVAVTRQDIALGIPKAGALCPLALALRRAYGTEATVTGSYAYLAVRQWYAISRRPLILRLSPDAGQFAVRFDRSPYSGETFEPFTFTATQVRW